MIVCSQSLNLLTTSMLYKCSLEELHLSFNEMKTPCNTEIILPKVTTLHYDGNCVEHRDHLNWISQNFPSLRSLVLCDCPLWTLRWSSSTQRNIQVILWFFSLTNCSHCFNIIGPGNPIKWIFS